VVHPLPPAPHFVGREAELNELRAAWRAGTAGVLALVGLGGAGKTAVAARFLDEILNPSSQPRPAGLFVWSFYQEPDAGRFLEAAYRYFAGGADPALPAKGTGLLHLLKEALAAGGPYLLVLDGLERVQRPETDGGASYGQLEDPLLKGLLTRLAEGTGRTMVLVTSRFPLTDLEPFRDRGYRHLDVGGLGTVAARALLRARGVRGEDVVLDALTEGYGAHALTLDHLGGVIGQFLGGDPQRAPEAPALTAPASDRQALRLARLLRAYEEHLPPAELALLGRLCLLRRSVAEDEIARLFLCTPVVHARTIRELAESIRQLAHSGNTPPGLLHDLANAIQSFLEEALSTAPVAGPQETFRQEVHAAVATVLHLNELGVGVEVADLARLYADKALDAPTDQRPLPAEDRDRFRVLYARYQELREHPLTPFQKPPAQLEAAFQGMGWKTRPPAGQELSPHDVVEAYHRVRQGLRHLVYKHFALRRVRELCRLYQQKWALAGPLAHLDPGELGAVLLALVGRHLVLREAGGTFAVHPAVRDHFGRLADASEQGTWHNLIREQLVSLIQKPGRQLPEDPRTLDLAEEAVYHALQAGRTDEAEWLFRAVLGGLRHLGWKLGEMARGLRVLREFDPCPDPWALAWFLRALGELEQAYAHNHQPCFRADLRLLQGRLPEAAAQGDATRAAIADFLRGRTIDLPPPALACAVPRARLFLWLGRLDAARRAAELEPLYHDLGWEGDRARCQLLLAEVARRQADLAGCQKHLQAATRWILHSGSVEHLSFWHLVRARAARSAGEMESARRTAAEGLHLAEQCGLGLDHVELLCEAAEIGLASGNIAAAEQAAQEAWRRATAPQYQFMWGAAEAGHLVGRALLAQGRSREAGPYLRETLNLRQSIGHPRQDETAKLMGESL
jgi:hypothetical protein